MGHVSCQYYHRGETWFKNFDTQQFLQSLKPPCLLDDDAEITTSYLVCLIHHWSVNCGCPSPSHDTTKKRELQFEAFFVGNCPFLLLYSPVYWREEMTKIISIFSASTETYWLSRIGLTMATDCHYLNFG